MQSALITDLEAIVKSGDEAAARVFMIEHIKELPADIQKRFVLEMFSEALDARIAAAEALVALQKDLAEAIDEVQKNVA